MYINNKYIFTDKDPVVALKINVCCARCDLLMVKGAQARKFDGATYYHSGDCPKPRMRHFAAHHTFSNDSYPKVMLS